MTQKRTNPSSIARKALNKFYLTDPARINLVDILGAENILYKEIECRGYQGNLVRNCGGGVINVNKNITNPHKKRFVIAHELGHWHLHKRRQLISCDINDLNIWKESINQIEAEANQFASEFLMPTEAFQDFCQKQMPSEELLIGISERFNVSITASSIKYKEFGRIPVALIYSTDSNILWPSYSRDFPFKFFNRQDHIPEGSLTHKFYSDGIQPASQTILAESWFTDDYSVKSDTYLQEFIFPIPKYNSCITFLWVYEVGI